MMPLNEVGPQDTTPRGTDTTISTSRDQTTRRACHSTGNHPLEWHADIGLVDNDHTPDRRSEGWVQAQP